MSERNTLIRSLHDLGLAAWFGGSLMGATGLNGAASDARDESERLRLSSNGWARWTPWQIAAIGAHAVGGVGLILANRSRLKHQSGATSTTVAKLVITVAAAGTTAYSGVLGAKVKRHQSEGASGATAPNQQSSEDLSRAQRQLKLVQWVTPVLTGVLVVLGAVQGEQQRGISALWDVSRAKVEQAGKHASRAVS